MDLLDYEGLLRYDELIKKDIAKKITGPSSSTDAHIVVFDGTTGKTVKDSGFTIGKSVPSNAVFTDTTYKLTVNGTANGGGSTSLGTIYAPTTAGTSGQILTSSGSGAPTWGTAPAAATIKYTTIDSNVTDINASIAANALLKTSQSLTAAEKTQVLTNLGIASARNITVSTSDPTSSDGNDGDIWFVYES